MRNHTAQRHLCRIMTLGSHILDLSKAFDCLPPYLITEKLRAYGLSHYAVELIHDYLSNRKLCAKIGKHCSSFQKITKGVPQGSILGPLIFNIFFIDIFYFIEKGKLFNYADDNYLSFSLPDFVTLLTVLEQESRVLIDWFSRNCMEANPEKFQAFAVGEKTYGEKPTFKTGETEIECEKTV